MVHTIFASAAVFSIMALITSLLIDFPKCDVCGSMDRGLPLPWLDAQCLLENKKPVGVTHTIDFGAFLIDYVFWFSISIATGSLVSFLLDVWRRVRKRPKG